MEDFSLQHQFSSFSVVVVFFLFLHSFVHSSLKDWIIAAL